MIWHGDEQRYHYYLEENGRNVAKRDSADDLETVGALALAAEVVRGERPHADLAANGIVLGEAVTGHEAKEQLLSELANVEALALRVTALWEALLAKGAVDGGPARLQALFRAPDTQRAQSLARAFEADWGDDDWTVHVAPPREGSVRITVTTRKLVLGPEVVEVLMEAMLDAERVHGCPFDVLELAEVSGAKPWWKLW